MGKTQIRISSLGTGPRRGHDTTVEVRKDSDSEWIDISSCCSNVDLSIPVDGIVKATIETYASSIVIDDIEAEFNFVRKKSTMIIADEPSQASDQIRKFWWDSVSANCNSTNEEDDPRV